MMAYEKNKLNSTIIVSVYKDAVALKLIVDALLKQTTNDFEVIISEDGLSNIIKDCVDSFSQSGLDIQHLTQEDDGFRKNIALNRAIKSSNTEHLIFIDGDCVPHPAFIEAHQQYASPGIASTGRRLELGETISNDLRNGAKRFNRLTNRLSYLLNIPALLYDRAKNIESGTYSKILHALTKEKEIRLLGCNFSCNKNDLLKINGFNEDYLSPGIGEDSDIDWRLVKSGVKIMNVKFSAIQYHLDHPRTYSVSEKNKELLEQTIKSGNCICSNGINKLQI